MMSILHLGALVSTSERSLLPGVPLLPYSLVASLPRRFIASSLPPFVPSVPPVVVSLSLAGHPLPECQFYTIFSLQSPCGSETQPGTRQVDNKEHKEGWRAEFVFACMEGRDA